MNIDILELAIHTLKYIFAGLILAFVAYVMNIVGPNKLTTTELVVFCYMAVSTYVLIDFLLPCDANNIFV